MNEVLTVPEVIDFLRCDKNTVYKLLKENQIKHFMLGNKYRIERKELEKFINQGGTSCNQ